MARRVEVEQQSMDTAETPSKLGAEIGRGTEAVVYEIVGRPGAVLRVDLDALSTPRLRGGMTAAHINSLCFEALKAAGVPTVNSCKFAHKFPDYLEISRLVSESLMDWAAHHPARLCKVGAVLGRVHSDIHSVLAPAELPLAMDLLPARWISASHPLRENVNRFSSREEEEFLHGSEQYFLHGDMNPSNIMRTQEGGEWIAIDWNGACRGPREADVAATLHQIRFGLAPRRWQGSAHFLLQFARSSLERSYLRTYEDAAGPLDQELLRRWLKLRKEMAHGEDGSQ